ncbi:MAG: bL28 family ribosomal protein [Firmicutes bacterium]|nr:bL28 family ribosomal protein [Bacillota bacterium]
MANICEMCGKNKMKGNQICITRSQVSRRTIKHFEPNIQKTSLLDDGGNKRQVKLCTKCIKTLKKEDAAE